MQCVNDGYFLLGIVKKISSEFSDIRKNKNARLCQNQNKSERWDSVSLKTSWSEMGWRSHM